MKNFIEVILSDGSTALIGMNTIFSITPSGDDATSIRTIYDMLTIKESYLSFTLRVADLTVKLPVPEDQAQTILEAEVVRDFA